MDLRTRRLLTAILAAGLGLAAALPATASPQAAGEPPQGAPQDLIEAYNRRDLGSPGVRRIRLELRTDGHLDRRFDIAHVWQRDDEQDGEIRSLVLLEEPESLRGTGYLLVEGTAEATGLEIYLHLPAGERGQVLTILPGRFDEGLLGSDFGYTDLLWRIPLRGRRVRALGERWIDGVDTLGFEVSPLSEEARASTTWDRTRFYLRRDPALLIAAEYFRDGEDGSAAARPEKRLRVHGWRQLDGVWTPDRMAMQVGESGRISEISLRRARFAVAPRPWELFAPAALPGFANSLIAGDTPEILRPLVAGR